ncbi:TetR/AcrR family transcriptional regulator [Deminuibacter soli]|uniref:TetR/AcrR family transcriptional regulator n=1 Tax=Deminuibacter soli TaxID=2291815 RepID=A0A3E1NH22_9BACT|nr:TetR/AcrR family transcriptional regulator [Deminuibacter soli]RFM27243.1 TetR/AcrR family transcriptional regulator [Deminuibacter soli]
MRIRDENKMTTIQEKALEMIVNEGFDGLSMQKLARAAGVSPATIYIYFKDRDDLIIQLYLQQRDLFFNAIIEGLNEDMDFATALKVQWKNRARFAIENPQTTHFLEHITYTPLYNETFKTPGPRFLTVMKSIAHKAIENKELAEMPFEMYWSLVFAPLYNLVRMHKLGKNMAGEPFVLTDEMLESTLKLVLKAIKP